VEIYDGLTPLADMLRDELRSRGIQSVVHAAGPFLGIIGDAARTPCSVVRIPEAEWEHRREQVEDCLALFQAEALVDEPDAE
jgi:hypothetical protein